MPALPIARKGLEAIAGRYAQVIQPGCGIQKRQFSPRLPLEGPEPPDILVPEEALRVRVGKAPDHAPKLSEARHSVKRNMVCADAWGQTRRV
jgi:hypothetical protein